ncbi:NfeD family protein [Methylotenera sp.]|uniref:NfeD family protein n=1 Tax=Methylotenera sp. TaxID=2051956 RepID=UPI002487C59E|nr:NfeD family protein [Methylotenera sp.]MDI1298364.1 NfeD family protein [Methylotenera sp.]
MDPMWMWAAIGIILLAVEMATGTFYVLWFGVAALCVALIMWFFPNTSEAIQYAAFAVLSLSSLAIWRINYKKTSTNSRVGQSQGEEIGRVGTVIETASLKQNGKIRFAQGLMGSREWTAIADETIESGSDASVVAVVGNALKISKK